MNVKSCYYEPNVTWKTAKMQMTININLIKVCRPTCNPTLYKYSGVGAKHHVDPRKIICISKISVQGTQRVKVIFKWLKSITQISLRACELKYHHLSIQ